MTTQESGTQWQSLGRSFTRSWNQLRAEVRMHWDRLTEDDIADIEGRLGRLRDKIAQRYGVAQDEAELQIREWVARDVPWLQQVRTVPSFRWTVTSLLVAIAAAILGFTDLVDLIQAISRAVFWIALVAFVVFLVIYLSMRARGAHERGPGAERGYGAERGPGFDRPGETPPRREPPGGFGGPSAPGGTEPGPGQPGPGPRPGL